MRGDRPRETRLTVEVRPRAGRNAVEVLAGGALRVRVTAPPAAGAANAAVRDLLARALRCPRAAVEIVRGAGTRTKMIRIVGLSADEVSVRLTEEG